MPELGQLLSFEYGAALPAEQRSGHGFAVFGSNGEVGRHDRSLVDGPGIVVGRKGSVGKVCWSEEPFWPIDTTYWVKCAVDQRRWVYWLLSRLPLRDLDSSTGVPGLNRNDAYELIVFEPQTSDEKSKIADILDTLDTTIRQTEAIIEKLKQVKQGLLHDLLTRGIDANGELRRPQSEAPGQYEHSNLGPRPSAWSVELLDQVAERGSGHTPSKGVASFWDGGIKWVSLADSHRLDQIYITETDKEISELGIANSSAVKHPAGTVILSRDAGVGKSAVLAHEMAVSQHFMAWRCGPYLNNLYLYFMLQRMKPLLEAIAMGSTVKTIGLDFFRKLRVFVPPRDEQDQVVGILMAAESDVLGEEQELAKLLMLKTGLMDDLLTGRVRVTALLDQGAPA
jgi:type I restriction enzyme S subunit